MKKNTITTLTFLLYQFVSLLAGSVDLEKISENFTEGRMKHSLRYSILTLSHCLFNYWTGVFLNIIVVIYLYRITIT